ncbi:MAG: hypothetical protein KIT17_26665 [Rubrivivax sp.]|nr:hypothetical protein [Rubrivivax sp.]
MIAARCAAPLRRAWRSVAGPSLAAAVVACSEGYPTADAPAFDPHGMTQGERLRTLNEVARSAEPGVRWRYSLQQGCLLHAERRARGEGTHTVVVALAQARTRLHVSEAERDFDVVVLRDGGDTTTVFESRRHIDALRAELLIKLIRRDCAALSGPGDEPERPGA